MRELLIPLLFAAILAPAARAADTGLAGSWRSVEAVQDGAPTPSLVGHQLRFDGDRFSITAADGTLLFAGGWHAEPAATPAAIDFANEAGGAAGTTWLGAYALEADRLTIVDNAPDPTRPRPTTLAAPAGSGYVLLVFDRDD